MTQAGDELREALTRSFNEVGGAVDFDNIESRPWASITFSSERHRVTLTVTDAVAYAFGDGLEDREIPMRGHILVDIEIAGLSREDGQTRLTLEALTVECK